MTQLPVALTLAALLSVVVPAQSQDKIKLKVMGQPLAGGW